MAEVLMHSGSLEDCVKEGWAEVHLHSFSVFFRLPSPIIFHALKCSL